MLIAIAIAVGAGILGGLGNFLITVQTALGTASAARTRARVWLDGFTALVLGIIASLLVPLFLSMASSELLSKSASSTGGSDVSRFVFFGFCLVAAVFSRRFIDTVAERAFRLADQANQKADEVKEDVREVTQTIEEPDARPTNDRRATVQDRGILDPAQLVLDAIEADPRYTRRTISGIVQDSGLTRDEVEKQLRLLREQGQVVEISSVDGERTLWRLTSAGRTRLGGANP